MDAGNNSCVCHSKRMCHASINWLRNEIVTCGNMWQKYLRRISADTKMAKTHYGDVIMGTMASQITIVYSTVYSVADQWKHQSSASLAFVWGIHRGPVNSPQKWPVTRKMLPFDDVMMWILNTWRVDSFPNIATCNQTTQSAHSLWKVAFRIVHQIWGIYASPGLIQTFVENYLPDCSKLFCRNFTVNALRLKIKENM